MKRINTIMNVFVGTIANAAMKNQVRAQRRKTKMNAKNAKATNRNIVAAPSS